MGLPVEVNNLMMGSLGGYTVGRSLRFRSSATAYLNRTPASAGNQQRWTWSGWVKRGALSYIHPFLFSCYQDDNNRTILGWYNSDQIALYNIDAAVVNLNLVSTAVYRDPSAWYHVVFSVDTTQATASNRAIIYVNGVQVTALSTATYPTQNTSLYMNSARQHRIGSSPESSAKYFDGYMAEVNFVDGQQLTPSSFGAYDTNGVWQPKKYTGTYGTNGFYLPFSNTTSTTTLVQDSSGNGNNWTPNNISLTAGTTYDSMIDSPTVSASASNYAVWNAVFTENSVSNATMSNGNLTATAPTTSSVYGFGTIGVSTGKWYWENTVIGLPSVGTLYLGLAQTSPYTSTYIRAYRHDTGEYYNGSAWVAYGATYTTNDIIGVALDMDSQTLTFYKNGTSQGQKTSIGLTGIRVFPEAYINYSPGSVSANFGQRPFSYTPPTGFNALNTYNLPTPTIANGAQYMAATTYTGNGGTAQSISNSGNNTIGTTFQPDLVWIKARSGALSNSIYDSVRGVRKTLSSNATNAEYSESAGVSMTAFNSNGFSVGAENVGIGSVNGASTTYIGWQWLAGGTGVTNTSGTISSTVSANPTAGFSVVTYTGNGSSSATVGHGLGVTPNMIFVKCRSTVNGWFVYHSSISAGTYLQLNSTAGANNISATADGAISTSPTSSTFGFTAGSVGVNNVNQNTQTFVSYCFAAVSGYSAFGSYTGNGSTDGPFVFTNFRPRWVMVKKSSATGNWLIFDTSRSPYNVQADALFPNLSNAETTTTSYNNDFLSNGFKIRTLDGSWNDSGVTYIYAAFAENPFKYSRAR